MGIHHMVQYQNGMINVGTMGCKLTRGQYGDVTFVVKMISMKYKVNREWHERMLSGLSGQELIEYYVV